MSVFNHNTKKSTDSVIPQEYKLFYYNMLKFLQIDKSSAEN